MKATMSAGVAASMADRHSCSGGKAPCMKAVMSFGDVLQMADNAVCPGGKACTRSCGKIGFGIPIFSVCSAEKFARAPPVGGGAELTTIGLAVGASVAPRVGGWVFCRVHGDVHDPKSCHGVRVPSSMTLLFSRTTTSPAVKVTSHPASQNWPIESKGLEASSGTMCPVLAAVGRSGMYISAV